MVKNAQHLDLFGEEWLCSAVHPRGLWWLVYLCYEILFANVLGKDNLNAVESALFRCLHIGGDVFLRNQNQKKKIQKKHTLCFNLT